MQNLTAGKNGWMQHNAAGFDLKSVNPALYDKQFEKWLTINWCARLPRCPDLVNQIQSHRLAAPKLLATAGLFSLLISAGAQANSFNLGDIDGLYNVRLTYGLLYRLDDADSDLIAFASGGEFPSANADDGNLNYSSGVVSNMLRATGELALSRGALGIYVRGAAFYDFQTEGSGPDRTDFSGSAENFVGSDVELRESYVNLNLSPGGMPIVLRAGQQILNWSETAFVRGGLDTINPADLVTALQPAGTIEDLRNPQRMVWAAANISETFSMEAYYQYEWQPVELPPVGWYFSGNDAVGAEGMGSWLYGNGNISDLGTDLDDYYQLPEGTLGFDQDFQRLPGDRRETPDDGGQYGVALIGVFPGSNAVKVGVHYLRYHSRLPLLSSRTADADAVLETAEPFVAARAAGLESVYLGEGLDPADAAVRGRQAAEELTVSGYANAASLYAEYPEDIDMIGFSFATSVLRTGSLVSGELTHHFDYPFQINPSTVTQAALSPVLFDDSIGDTSLGEYGASEVVVGYERFDRSQLSLQLAQIFRGRFWADQLVVSADLAWVKVYDLPNRGEAQLTSSDGDSWGYRLQVAAAYFGVGGGVNVEPFVAFSHDVDGTTPGPVSTFVEERKIIAMGIRGTYINRFSAELRYVSFFDGGRTNTLRDRDYLRLQLSYSL